MRIVLRIVFNLNPTDYVSRDLVRPITGQERY